MVSALACSSSAAAHLPPLLAVGFVSGLVSVADPRTGEVLLSLEGGHADAATTLAWSPCGWYLYSAARRDGAVRCWDVRGAASVLPAAAAGGGGGGGTLGGGCALSLSRASRWTQQRIALAVEPVAGRHLLSGGEDGWVRAFDLRAAAAERADSAAAAPPAAPAPPPPRPPPPPPTPPPPPPPPPSTAPASTSTGWRVSRESVAAVAIHPWLPLVAAGSGCRRSRGGGRRRRGKGGRGGSGRQSGSESGGDDNDDETALPRAALSFWRPSYTWRESETARNPD